MKTLRRWNYENHSYEPYHVPDHWNVKIYSDDMNEKVNCPHCGAELPFGSTLTSMEIHTDMGFGYGICEDCYRKEFERKMIGK